MKNSETYIRPYISTMAVLSDSQKYKYCKKKYGIEKYKVGIYDNNSVMIMHCDDGSAVIKTLLEFARHYVWIDDNNVEYPCGIEEMLALQDYSDYETPEEFINGQRLHGPNISSYDDETISYQCAINSKGIVFISTGNDKYRKIPLFSLLKRFKWEDGTPCGLHK